MKTILSILLTGAICVAAPKLSTGGARNGASFASTTALNGGVAQGSRFVLVGKALGPADSASNEAYPLSTELGGVGVKVTVGTTTVDAWVLSVSASRVVALLPSTTPVGKGKVRLTFNGESTEGDIEVVSRAVGLYTGGGTGTGQAIANAADGGAALVLSASARPGQQIKLRATGLGAVEGDEASGPTARTFDAGELEVRIGDTIGTISAAVRTEIPGIDELTVEVPTGVTGCFTPVVVRSGLRYSNFVTVPVAANGGFCSSNLVSSGTIESAAGTNGEIRIGSISLTRIAIGLEQGEFVTDGAAGVFQKYKVEDYGISTTAQTELALNSCMVFSSEFVEEELPEVPFNPSIDLAAGVLTVNGPKGSKNLGNVKGTFSVELGSGINIVLPPGVPNIPGLPSNLYLDPGNYTITGAGGADVGAFNVQVQLNPVDWTNPNVATSIDRSQPLTLTWTGGRPNDYVMAIGTSSSRTTNATFVCIARAPELKITVGTHILQNLPASTLEGSILGVFSISEPKSFTASGLDAGSVVFSRMAARQAVYR
jgi:uncharacterized protein (TIGR03437 family)